MSQLANELESELNEAIRRGLRAAGVEGVLAYTVAAIMDQIEPVLTRKRLTTEEVAKSIKDNGGFIRVGVADAFIEGHYITAGQLLDAVLLNSRGES